MTRLDEKLDELTSNETEAFAVMIIRRLRAFATDAEDMTGPEALRVFADSMEATNQKVYGTVPKEPSR